MLRTHTCGELRATHEGEEVTLAGWIDTIRTHGNITFVDLRDRYGTTQLVLKEELKASRESVIQITGIVATKPQANKKLKTGEIEIQVSSVNVLSSAATMPFDENATEDTRLQYRYLDLRRAEMQKRLKLRADIITEIRSFLNNQEFIELETPILARSTPEGARDYLVPSRTQKGNFYALPQSPQLFKQLFMIAGYDKYYQVARCFRDEDLRKDRQPEFTQIDIELSFVEQEDVMALNEALAKQLWKKFFDVELDDFERMTYKEAMSTYGVDRPDTRFGLELSEITELAHKTDFKVFTGAEYVTALHVKHDFSRKDIDKLTDVAKTYHAKGLAWTTCTGEELDGGVAKFLKPIEKELIETLGLEKGETVFFMADDKHTAQTALGAVRTQLGEDLKLRTDTHNFLWVTDFPMFEYSQEQERYVSMHHPFTMPAVESAEDLSGDELESISSIAYDLVLNGSEIAGGSIRIHDQEIQSRVFELLGITQEEASERFGFFVEALKYGTPPHGGVAWGLDRLVTIMAGVSSIRDVIAFPKNKHAQDLMMKAPSSVDQEQLDELGISKKQ